MELTVAPTPERRAQVAGRHGVTPAFEPPRD
jgi:hypothetical protein